MSLLLWLLTLSLLALSSLVVGQCMKHIHYEDDNTRYVDIGPVNKVINMLCCWFEDPDGLPFKK
jgi:cycloartenol synthase